MEDALDHMMEDNEEDVQTKAQERIGDDRHRWLNGNNLTFGLVFALTSQENLMFAKLEIITTVVITLNLHACA